ncbi:MAG: transcription termination/antitermination protein NusG [Eubacteriales bacterium]|nr:transcription termination/antitermination protein NusG [Eubacteriales bacterium]MDD4513393.1 transcription termination/antitermination protein NusG [Eubacteriales bacterium]
MSEEEKVPQWYVVHTYSGYENKVRANLEKAVENNGMQELITDIQVPVEEAVEIRNGRRVVSQHKTYPGYVLVKMIITNESWYVVRNTRGVTGFVGPESKPVSLSEAEVENMLHPATQGVSLDLSVGDTVRILSGPLENFTGRIEEVDSVHEKLRVRVEMFGRDTPVDVEYNQVIREELK